MSKIVRVRVELKNKYNDPERNFKEMLREFNKRVGDEGVLHTFREHTIFESPGEKRRRKKRENLSKIRNAELERKVLNGERVKAPAGLIKKIIMGAKKKQRYQRDEE
jgi:ribosomal protein S21